MSDWIRKDQADVYMEEVIQSEPGCCRSSECFCPYCPYRGIVPINFPADPIYEGEARVAVDQYCPWCDTHWQVIYRRMWSRYSYHTAHGVTRRVRGPHAWRWRATGMRVVTEKRAILGEEPL